MKRLIALIILLFVISSSCFAFKTPDDKKRWVYLYKNDTESVYLDTNNYQSFYGSYKDKAGRNHINHYIASTWLWRTEPNPYVDYQLERVVYDLSCNMYALTRVIKYDNNAKVVSDKYYTALGKEAVPGSRGEVEVEAVKMYEKFKEVIRREQRRS